MRILSFKLLLLFGGILFTSASIKAQALTVGTPVLEDYYRRQQLLGKLDSSISFTVRPLTSEALGAEDVYRPVITGDFHNDSVTGASHTRKIKFRLLPVSLQAQYNLKAPYDWNDGAMIPARGVQSLLSAGLFVRYGLLSLQLKPEIIYAENKDFIRQDSYSFDEAVDLPQRFGEKSYSKITTGQSSLGITISALFIGFSSENLWWGPGIFNSLLMSNHGPGFNHLRINTIKPLKTNIGSFEGQIIGGTLKSSGFTEKLESSRYLSGLSFNYQPKLVPGLFLGLTRAIQMYKNEMKKLTDYIPIVQSLNQKNNFTGVSKDQLISVFSRWIWKDSGCEIYFEYGRGDHSATSRDLITEPEHSRAYLFGLEKILELPENRSLQLNFEATHLQQPINHLIRNASSWYTHGQILQGYTHRGQILGAGIGPGKNQQVLRIMLTDGFEHIGIQFSRSHQALDYYSPASSNSGRQYRNFDIGLSVAKKFKPLLLNLAIANIKQSTKLLSGENEKFFDIHASLGLIYYVIK